MICGFYHICITCLVHRKLFISSSVGVEESFFQIGISDFGGLRNVQEFFLII